MVSYLSIGADRSLVCGVPRRPGIGYIGIIGRDLSTAAEP